MDVYQLTDRPSIGETNGLCNPAEYNKVRSDQGFIQSVCWTTPGLEIIRLRLLSDPGFGYYDVSYCDGILNGMHVNVLLPFSQLTKYRKGGYKAELFEEAKKTGVFIKGLFGSLSVLC